MRGGEERRVALYIVVTVVRIDSERLDIDSGRPFRQLLQYFRREMFAYTSNEDRSRIGEKKSEKYYLFSLSSYS